MKTITTCLSFFLVLSLVFPAPLFANNAEYLGPFVKMLETELNSTATSRNGEFTYKDGNGKTINRAEIISKGLKKFHILTPKSKNGLSFDVLVVMSKSSLTLNKFVVQISSVQKPEVSDLREFVLDTGKPVEKVMTTFWQTAKNLKLVFLKKLKDAGMTSASVDFLDVLFPSAHAFDDHKKRDTAEIQKEYDTFSGLIVKGIVAGLILANISLLLLIPVKAGKIRKITGKLAAIYAAAAIVLAIVAYMKANELSKLLSK